jgi:uncharacterized protein YcgI (DUF1989 family)
MTSLETLPARAGRAIPLAAGEALRIVNTHGSQVVDAWAFNAADLDEFLSMPHLRAVLGGVFPKAGDALVTNQRRPILTLEEDTSPGIHDTLIAACDRYRYEQLGCAPGHASCADNLYEALAAIGLTPPVCPSPLNLWMNIPVGPDGAISWLAPVSKPGDHVLLRAAMDCVVVLSACPQDMLPINGADQTPRDVAFQVLPAA